MQELKLHDIKPLVAIDDYSIYYFSVVVVIATIIVLFAIYMLLKWLRQRKRENIRKKHLEILHNIDLSDTKKAAYELTKYGLTFRDDDERHKELYENMVSKLANYKYKKEVGSFDDETISIINLYRDICDV